jgi:hypothetical protein
MAPPEDVTPAVASTDNKNLREINRADKHQAKVNRQATLEHLGEHRRLVAVLDRQLERKLENLGERADANLVANFFLRHTSEHVRRLEQLFDKVLSAGYPM